MDSAVEFLLKLASSADTLEVRLRTLLRYVQAELSHEAGCPVSMWITDCPDDAIDSASVILNAKGEFLMRTMPEHPKPSYLPSGPAAFMVPVVAESTGGAMAAGYWHVDHETETHKQLLGMASGVVAALLLAQRRQKLDSELRDAIALLRKQLLDMGPEVPTTEELFSTLDDVAVGALRHWPSCLLVYDVGMWRRRARVPHFAARGMEMPSDEQMQQLCEQLGRCLPDLGRGQTLNTTEHGLHLLSVPGCSRAFVVAQPLIDREKYDPDVGLPFTAVIVFLREGTSLHWREPEILRRFVHAMGNVRRLREYRAHLQGIERLSARLLSTSPGDAADVVREHLNEAFDASEVAVLERRGNFLYVISRTNEIDVSRIPPLHIRKGKDQPQVCYAAHRSRSFYDADVSKRSRREANYLAVVQETRSQFAVPLHWRNDLVGVLLVGIGVVDGLSESDQRVITAIAEQCAGAISNAKQAEEERAVRHTISSALATAALTMWNAQQTKDTEEYRGRLDKAYESLERARKLVKDWMIVQSASAPQDITLGERGKGDDYLDLHRVIREVVEDPMLQALKELHPGVSIQVQEKGPVTVLAHEESLKLALLNIIQNAIEAMGEQRGVVRLSVGRKLLTNMATDKGKSPGSTLRFAVINVADEGPGISERHQERIFQYGWSGADGNSSQHLGVGLPVARRAMQAFGGRLHCESSSEEGSVFSLWVPLAHSANKR
jgi:signal transduction histidine kinase